MVVAVMMMKMVVMVAVLLNDGPSYPTALVTSITNLHICIYEQFHVMLDPKRGMI